MNNIKNVESITEQELNAGIFGGLSKGSWHEKYKDSAWVFLGGFPFELSEGDIICVMSQWGEIEDINLVRDKLTNKSKGFAFIKYEDNRSTILAVDNFNGTKLLGRTLRCDHVEEYRLPKEVREKELEALEEDPEGRVEIGPGHAYKNAELADEHNVSKGVDLWKKPAENVTDNEKYSEERQSKHKKDKKEKKEKKDKKVKKEKKDKVHRSERRSREEGEEDSDGSKSRSDDSRHKHSRHSHSRSSDRRDDVQDSDYRRSGDSSRVSSHSMAATSSSSAPSLHAAAYARPGATAGSSAQPLGGSSSMGGGGGSVFTVGGAVASWRGNRDPVAIAAPVAHGKSAGFAGGFAGTKRPYDGSSYGNNGSSGGGTGGGQGYAGSSSNSSSGGLSGIGGMNRTR